MLKKIDSQAVRDLFYLKKIKIGEWCADKNIERRVFYNVINNDFGLAKPGRATRHIHAALERDGLMVYLEDDAADAVDQAV